MNHYTGAAVACDPKQIQIRDPLLYDYTAKRDAWSLEDVKLFLVEFFNAPKDFFEIAKKFRNKTTKDLVNFYFNFKKHLRIKHHMRELSYVSNKRRRDAAMEKAVAEILGRIDLRHVEAEASFARSHLGQELRSFTTNQLLAIFSRKSEVRSRAPEYDVECLADVNISTQTLS